MLPRNLRLILTVVAVFSAFGLTASARNEPYIVHDTNPVIMAGPLLSKTGATIVWVADTPGQAQVVYGLKGEALSRKQENAQYGSCPSDLQGTDDLED